MVKRQKKKKKEKRTPTVLSPPYLPSTLQKLHHFSNNLASIFNHARKPLYTYQKCEKKVYMYLQIKVK